MPSRSIIRAYPSFRHARLAIGAARFGGVMRLCLAGDNCRGVDP